MATVVEPGGAGSRTSSHRLHHERQPDGAMRRPPDPGGRAERRSRGRLKDNRDRIKILPPAKRDTCKGGNDFLEAFSRSGLFGRAICPEDEPAMLEDDGKCTFKQKCKHDNRNKYFCESRVVDVK